MSWNDGHMHIEWITFRSQTQAAPTEIKQQGSGLADKVCRTQPCVLMRRTTFNKNGSVRSKWASLGHNIKILQLSALLLLKRQRFPEEIKRRSNNARDDGKNKCKCAVKGKIWTLLR